MNEPKSKVLSGRLQHLDRLRALKAADTNWPVLVVQFGRDSGAHMRRREFSSGLPAEQWRGPSSRAQEARRLYRILWVSTVSQSRSVSGRFSPRGARAGICRGRERCFRNALCTWKSLALRQVISELRRGNINLAVSSGPATRAMTTVTTFPPSNGVLRSWAPRQFERLPASVARHLSCRALSGHLRS